MRLSFVILHYNTYDDTIECVESIKKYVEPANRNIIIVDNASPDGSGARLKSTFEVDNEVKVILSDKNLGFARGNNLGFKYAKDKLQQDFIVLLNNDTLLLNDKICSLIEKEYDRSHFAVLGPKVITPTPPYDSNPGVLKLQPISYYKKLIFKYRCFTLMNRLGLDIPYRRFKERVKRKQRLSKPKEIDKIVENCQLHGCFLVFSQEYISKFDGLDDRTFLYYEEQLLFMRLKNNYLKSVYLPNLEIYHKEDKASNSIPVSNSKKQLFLYKNWIHSLQILVSEMIQNNK